jgi:hypothetical protein
MAGVGQGAPTEFKIKGEIMPADLVPAWKPEMINQFNQDDIYVEMTFLRTLEQYGLDAPIRQAGIDFANSGYPLWHANKAGRENLRRGIAPPDSGHPAFNKHADDIDYQIEADFAGLIAPGLPNTVIRLGETFGRLMNYGDGLYGGQFVGGMYAAAFFETDPVKLVEAGLACIPRESQYAECVRDMLAWHRANPDDWEKTWTLLEAKYHTDPAYTHGLCSGPGGKGAFSIDAKLNGAYIVMGLLYGGRDPEKTIVISTRCGQDSDCNPSSAAGVLFATMGYAALPDTYKSALNPEGKFSHTPYNFPALISVCEQLARQAVAQAGGKVEKAADGTEVFVIPVQTPKPTALERSYEPGPAANVKFTPEEMGKITAASAEGKEPGSVNLQPALDKFAAGWKVANCGPDMDPGLLSEWGGREKVLMTHPLVRGTGCVLSRKVEVPAGRKTSIVIVVANDPRGDFDLVVRADGKELLKQTVAVNTEEKSGQWLTLAVDLAPLAGKTATVEVVNQPTDWRYEAAYFADLRVVSE